MGHLASEAEDFLHDILYNHKLDGKFDSTRSGSFDMDMDPTYSIIMFDNDCYQDFNRNTEGEYLGAQPNKEYQAVQPRRHQATNRAIDSRALLGYVVEYPLYGANRLACQVPKLFRPDPLTGSRTCASALPQTKLD
jgi:hypothetical protein